MNKQAKPIKPGARKRNENGTLAKEDVVRKCVTIRPEISNGVQDWADVNCSGNFSYAVDALLLIGLRAEGFVIEGVEQRPLAGKQGDTTSASGDGNTQVVNSNINASTADEAMAATQIGNANRNVNVKKNHAEPARPAKRRK